ncbi:tetrathionate reductase subunit B [Salmonella enterica subsp. arizonae]|uniref:Tetrathionate reductase subunit B n=1 Tax=Salmonella enterica subsp. arizonae TaxID=59203 RepID=A0A379S5D5_SALER|nr:tetrathionate reductase subunit B [Salmonella enterica subsp. arizonae]
MDSSKRQLLQQLGILTVWRLTGSLAEAKFPFSPERHEGSFRHRYAMLIDLRRCIGCQSCTVSCTIETKRRRARFARR